MILASNTLKTIFTNFHQTAKDIISKIEFNTLEQSFENHYQEGELRIFRFPINDFVKMKKHENECLSFLYFFLSKFSNCSKLKNISAPLCTLVFRHGFCHACYSLPFLKFD